MFNTRPKIGDLAGELFEESGAMQPGKQVLEINGDAGSGKSALLQHLALKTLLPKQHNGSGMGVIYFDLDYHFELPQFVSVMEQRTKVGEEEIKAWLSNLFLVRCDTAEQLVVTLHSIEPIIANSKIPIGLLILDSITSFYWIDSHTGGKSQYLRELNMNKVIEILKIFRDKYGMSIVAASQHLLNPEQKPAEGINLQVSDYCRPFFSRQWQDFIRHRFVVTKSSGKNGVCYTSHKIGTQSRKNFLIGCEGVQFVS